MQAISHLFAFIAPSFTRNCPGQYKGGEMNKDTEDTNLEMGVDVRVDVDTAVAIGIGGLLFLIITIVVVLSQI